MADAMGLNLNVFIMSVSLNTPNPLHVIMPGIRHCSRLVVFCTDRGAASIMWFDQYQLDNTEPLYSTLNVDITKAEESKIKLWAYFSADRFGKQLQLTLLHHPNSLELSYILFSHSTNAVLPPPLIRCFNQLNITDSYKAILIIEVQNHHIYLSWDQAVSFHQT